MKIYTIEAGNFKLDGGAMFGVVPKKLWQKTNPADEDNLIEMSCRCLLIENENRLILVDTGFGNKQSSKFFGHYKLWGKHSLENSFDKIGFSKDEITDVFLTHLHFDHCGGAVIRESKSGSLLPAFKNATYWVHKAQWKWANNPNSREKASFLKENILPLYENGCLKLIEGDGPVLSKTPFPFKILLVNGHTEKQMLPIIKYRGRRIIYVADLIPTVGHLPIPYIMGYDTRPLITLKEKEIFLNDALKSNSRLFFERDPHNELISIQKTGKGIRMKEQYKFDSHFSDKL